MKKGTKKWLTAALLAVLGVATVFDLGPVAPLADAALCVVAPDECQLTL